MARRAFYTVLLVVIWTVPGLVAASINAALYPGTARRVGVLVYVLAQAGPWWVWLLLTPPIVWLTRRLPVERGRLVRSLPLHVMAALTCSAMFIMGSALVALVLIPPTEPLPALLVMVRGYISSRVPMGLFLYAAVVGVTIAVDERARRRDRELVSVRLESALARAQLQALQMQLQPHFLFNTLHAISMLVEENPEAASRTIALLGDLLRETLLLADVPEHSLREELGVLRRYLEIEQIRFRDRLTVTEAIGPDTLDSPVPSFLLQPLVENAVRHGVAPRANPGRVTVRARRDGRTLMLEVEDDGPGFASTPQREPGIGLAATRERLAVLYGERASLSCRNSPEGGARVTVTIPVRDG